jgi:hypothetical protein
MRIATTIPYRLAPAIALLLISANVAVAQVSITAVETAIAEDFNTLMSSGTSSVTPAGWTFLETLGSANLLYSAGTGSSTTGDTYSFGAAGNGERAFGQLRSSAVTTTLGAQLQNNTGLTIGGFDISYFGEEWRRGGSTGGADHMDFQYSLNATSLSTGTWVDINSLDFNSPIVGATATLDGNLAVNRTALSGSASLISIAPAATFWIRWTDVDITGSDDGLAVDDFSITAHEAPVPTVPVTLGKVKASYR